MIGTGYTQFRMVGLCVPGIYIIFIIIHLFIIVIPKDRSYYLNIIIIIGFDFLVFDCVSKTLTYSDLILITDEILIITYKFGFDIGMLLTCDGLSCNRALYKRYFTIGNPRNDPNDHGIKCCRVHPRNDKLVFFVPDPSHDFKKLNTSLDNKNHFIFKVKYLFIIND